MDACKVSQLSTSSANGDVVDSLHASEIKAHCAHQAFVPSTAATVMPFEMHLCSLQRRWHAEPRHVAFLESQTHSFWLPISLLPCSVHATRHFYVVKAMHLSSCLLTVCSSAAGAARTAATPGLAAGRAAGRAPLWAGEGPAEGVARGVAWDALRRNDCKPSIKSAGIRLVMNEVTCLSTLCYTKKGDCYFSIKSPGLVIYEVSCWSAMSDTNDGKCKPSIMSAGKCLIICEVNLRVNPAWHQQGHHTRAAEEPCMSLDSHLCKEPNCPAEL